MSPLLRPTAQIPEDVAGLVKAVSASGAGDAQKVAAALIELQLRTYNAISRQGVALLGWALAVALLGLAFLSAAPFLLLPRAGADTARHILIFGEIIEGLAALLLLFFGINLLRLAACQHQLSRLQRFTLANNLSQALPDESRHRAHAEQADRLSGGTTVADVLGQLTTALDRVVSRARQTVPPAAATAVTARSRPAVSPDAEAAAREEADTNQQLPPA
jgi:hypothetical protein